MSDAEMIRHAERFPDPVADRLGRAGCVFATEEAAILREFARSTAELTTLCARRVSGEPLEHIVGYVWFGELRLSVGPGVFVPRQRSRLLAQAAITAARVRRSQIVVEAFCGVAPIASAVRQALPWLEIHVADIDGGALAHAAVNLGGAGRVHQGAGFDAVPEMLRGRIGVIAAVPPYVPTTASEFLPREALEHEPHRALFGGPDGLDHIGDLIEEAPEWLSDNGCVLIEMNTDQVADTASRAAQIGYGLECTDGGDRQTVVVGLRRAH